MHDRYSSKDLGFVFIFSKYEEIRPIPTSYFAEISDGACTPSQILRMESLILKVLSFDLAMPTTLLFVNYFAKICKCEERTQHLAMVRNFVLKR